MKRCVNNDTSCIASLSAHVFLGVNQSLLRRIRSWGRDNTKTTMPLQGVVRIGGYPLCEFCVIAYFTLTLLPVANSCENQRILAVILHVLSQFTYTQTRPDPRSNPGWLNRGLTWFMFGCSQMTPWVSTYCISVKDDVRGLAARCFCLVVAA